MAEINNREIILEILMEILEKKQFSHVVINNTIENFSFLDKRDRAFIKRVSEGSVENLISIDYVINSYSKIKVKKMKPEIRNILRLSVYQIIYMDSVPDHSACDEAVKLTIKTKKYKSLKGFVNGLLRNICREKENIIYPDPAVEYSIPEWIMNQWIEQYGDEIACLMAKSVVKNAPIYIRPGKELSKEKLKEKLTNANNTDALQDESTKAILLDAPYIPDALEVSNFNQVSDLPGFESGDFYIQDISSMLVGLIAAPSEGMTCIDMCAAPGGKSLHLAKLMNNTGRIISFDVSEKKVELLEENIERSGFSNIEAKVGDGCLLNKELLDLADVVICDLPCSGLGVIGRKADIRYNISPDSQDELVKLQRKILTNAVRYIKSGGILIYSTCTTNREENINNFNWILENFDFKPVDLEAALPPKTIEEVLEDTKKVNLEDTLSKGYIQLLQGVHKCDGFFISKLQKK